MKSFKLKFINFIFLSASTEISTELTLDDEKENQVVAPMEFHSTPIDGKKLKRSKRLSVKKAINNSLNFDDLNLSEVSTTPSPPTIKNLSKNKFYEKMPEIFKSPELEDNIEDYNEDDDDDSSLDSCNISISNYPSNNNDPEKWKKVLLDAVSFSDTFDIENEEEMESKLPDNVPFFIDLEPIHFKQVIKIIFTQE